MPVGSRQRFGAPRRDQHPVRYKAVGVGAEAFDVIPQDDDRVSRHEEEQSPDSGFTGVRSRSRFTSPIMPIEIGHGDPEGGFSPQGHEPQDPATGRSLFRRFIGFSLSERSHRQTTSGMGSDDEELVQDGALRYIRRFGDATNAGSRPADMIRWGDAPVPRAMRSYRYTVRDEFEQGAQDFLGQHTVVPKHGNASTSPVRMRAPRLSRLSRRARSGSYGQTTTELN